MSTTTQAIEALDELLRDAFMYIRQHPGAGSDPLLVRMKGSKNMIAALRSPEQVGQDSRWISVDERLPEDGVDVLVYRPLAPASGDEPYTIDKCYAKRVQLSPQKIAHHFTRWCHPTHWQPLPAPPSNTDQG